MQAKSIYIGALFAALSGSAFAQSTPNLSYGQVPTAGQWNSYFAAKQDALGYRPLNRAGDTMTGSFYVAPSTIFKAGINFAPGVDVANPQNGDAWISPSGFNIRVNNTTYNLSGGPIACSQLPALIGDITSTAGSCSTTLATVNANVGSVGGASAIPVLTLDGKGRVTAASTAAVAAPASGLTGGTLAPGVVNSSLATFAAGAAYNNLAANSIDATKFAQPGAGAIVGNPTAAAANASLSSTLTAYSDYETGATTQGGVLYRGAAKLQAIVCPTSAPYIKSGGPGANPTCVATSMTPVSPQQVLVKPTSSTLSGTYTVPSGATRIEIEGIAAGQGGGGGGTGSNGSGANGGDLTFGPITLAGGNSATTSSLGTAIGDLFPRGAGSAGGTTGSSNTVAIGGAGGTGIYGGAGAGGSTASAGGAGQGWGSGGGGGGTGNTSGANAGPGGASGTGVKAFIFSPAASYSYSVPPTTTGGTASANGGAGGGGAAGYLRIVAYFN